MSGEVRTLWRLFRAPTETTYNMTGTPAGSTPASSSQSAMTLPEIRTVTPIQPFSIPRQPTDESIMTTSSVISHDSRTTALTSPSSLFPDSPTASARLNVTSSHSLRKSISVDSFIKTRPSDLSEPGPSSNVHPFPPEGGLNNNNLEERDFPSNHAGVHGQPVYSLASLGRTRGHSLSGASAFDHDDLYLDDSELERVTDVARLPLLPSHRSRLASAQAAGKGKAKARPGNVLLLPPRAPTLSNASSTSSLSSIANSAVTIPPVPPIPPLHHRRPNAPEPLIMPRRTRSGSFGARASFSFWNPQDPAFSIAVVGPAGCGKTTVIRKGLKACGVSDESICTVLTPNGRLRYGSRSINVPRDEEKMGHVFELDSDLLHLDSPDGAWPKDLPPIDGVLVCYDASDPASFERVPDLLACYHALHLSAVAMACKCDLDKKVLPHHASERAAPYNVGLVEVTSVTDAGKRKMRHCFHWLIRAIEKSKRGDIPAGSPYRNPASPDVLNAPWSDAYGYPETRNGNIKSRVSTPSAGSPSTTTKFREHPLSATAHVSGSPTPGTSTPTARSPSVPTSPVRVKSTNDLVTEVERSRQEERRRESSEGRAVGLRGRTASMSAGSFPETLASDEKEGASLERNGSVDVRDGRLGKGNEPPPMPWATLEELLEKLFFLAVSGDDPTFIKYFFLTYRKFATPRNVLLGMQKRIRQLNQEHADLLIGSYAQMRICDLLVEWIESFPTDFAAPGTSGAITALVKQISSNPCTLHYGSDILPFLDEIPGLQDVDMSWAIQSEDSREESDDDGLESLESLDDDEEHGARRGTVRRTVTSVATRLSVVTTDSAEPKPKVSSTITRDRKSSLPLSAKLISTPLTITLSGSSDFSRSLMGRANASLRNTPKDLAKLSQTLASYDPLDVAQQITKMQSEIFLGIEPRQWLRYTMGDAKLEQVGEPISASANFYNQLANWVSSLILAHDRVKLRERQVERFVELAGKLRMLNNYVGLRAVMSGISNATFPNDEILTMFRDNKIRQYQQFLGWEILLNSQHNHRAYRLALRHTNGPCIPDMEVHTFDMVRANESNPNYKADDPSKIHWGKFTLMARMITMLQGLQDKIRSSGQFDYPERKWIREILNSDVMDEETMRSRVFLPPDDAEPIFPLAQGLESPNATRTEAARFKRLFFW